MKRLRRAVVMIVPVVAACDGSVATPESATGAGADAGADVATDTSVRPQPTQPPTNPPIPCPDENLTFNPMQPYVPVKRQLGACADDLIAHYARHCVERTATCAQRFGPNAPASANDCFACLDKNYGSGQGVVIRDVDRKWINQPGCFELRGDTACAARVHTAIECVHALCTTCGPTFDQCAQTASAGRCSVAVDAAKVCVQARPECGPALTESNVAAYGALFCGVPPAVDAGAD